MEGRAAYKVPGGKLLRARVTFDSKISSAALTGDFFAYPDGSIDAIESVLTGMDVSSSEEEIAEALDQEIKNRGIELIGIDARLACGFRIEPIDAKGTHLLGAGRRLEALAGLGVDAGIGRQQEIGHGRMLPLRCNRQ